MEEIPYGFCQCGCEEKAPVSDRNHTRYGWIKGEPKKFIKGHNRNFKGIRLCGEDNRQWKGGRSVASDGYVRILRPEHPRADTKGYVREHILIAEKALEKPLPPKAVVHHANGTTDKGPLVICEDQAYHLLLHQRARALKACGHASWRKCWICQEYDAPENMYVPLMGKATHRECVNAYQRKKPEQVLVENVAKIDTETED